MGQGATQLAAERRGRERDARSSQLQEYMVRRAVAEHDAAGLAQLVRYVDVNAALASGETLLVFAVKQGWADAVHVLLEAGEEDILSKWIKFGVLKTVGDLLCLLCCPEADPSQPDLTGSLPLHTAVLVNNAHIIAQLVTHRGIVNRPDATGLTALHVACCKGHTDLVVQLLQAGGQPDLATNNQEKCTSLMLAASCGYEDCAKALLEAKANPDFQDYRGHTAVSRAAIHNYPAVVKVLLTFGANPTIPNRTKTTPLQLAAVRNHCDVVKCLLEGGTKPDKHSSDLPPLHAAALNGCCVCAKHLLDCAVNIETEDNQRRTALFCAMADMPHVEHHYRYNPLVSKDASRVAVATHLVERGADVSRVWRSRFCFTRQRSAHQVALYKLAMRACQPLNMRSANLEELLQKLIIVRCADALILFRVVFPQVPHSKIEELLSVSNGKWESVDSSDVCKTCEMEGSSMAAECKKYTKEDVLSLIARSRSRPMSLKRLCRKRIRKVLSKNVLFLVSKLDISEELKSFIGLSSLAVYG